MYYLTKIFEIPMAHRLSKLEKDRRCFLTHGHNLEIEVTIKSNYLDNNDMVMDFSDLKNLIIEVVDSWDHGLFLNKCDENKYENCVKHIFDQDPTSEVLCKFLYQKLTEKLTSRYKNIFVHSIGMWETKDSKCTYTEEL